MVLVEDTQTQRSHPQSWNAAELLASGFGRRELPDAVADEFRRFCADHPDAAGDVDGFAFDAAALPRLAAFAAEARRELVAGCGLAWVRAPHGLSEPEQRLFFLAFGSALGEVLTQYGRMFELRDRGLDYKREAIPVSMTGAPTGFHTDSSRLDVEPTFVGLLCEQPSTRGGESLVSNALRAHEMLEREHPDALAVLRRPLIRDLVTPGVEKTPEQLRKNRFPVFQPAGDHPGGVLFRYMRYWIERGQEKAGQPLGTAETAALDTLDTVLGAPENVVRFRLEAGDVVWINNRTLAHNRTGYEDSADNVRRLQRMWVQVR